MPNPGGMAAGTWLSEARASGQAGGEVGPRARPSAQLDSASPASTAKTGAFRTSVGQLSPVPGRSAKFRSQGRANTAMPTPKIRSPASSSQNSSQMPPKMPPMIMPTSESVALTPVSFSSLAFCRARLPK